MADIDINPFSEHESRPDETAKYLLASSYCSNYLIPWAYS